MDVKLQKTAKQEIIVLTTISIILYSLFYGCAQPSPASGESSSQITGSTTPRYGGTLRLAIANTPPMLDPVLAGTSGATNACVKTYTQNLVWWTGKNNLEAELVPGIAKSWEVSPDGLTYTFKLREGIRFQNIPPVNGRELVSEDIKFHFQRIINPATRSPLIAYGQGITGIETPDNYTIAFKIKEPQPGWISNWPGGAVAMFAPEVVKQDGHLNKTWIGVGPFIFKEYSPNVKAVFEKNPDYWEKGKPYLDKVEMLFIQDEAQRLAAFRAGEIDLIDADIKLAELAKNSIPSAQVVSGVLTAGHGLVPNIAKNPEIWGNKKVRQALLYAIDYDGLIASALNGGAMRTGYLSYQLYKDWGGRALNELPKKDTARAKALLAEAGFPKGFKTTILQNVGGVTSAPAVEPVLAMLKDIGIECDVKPLDNTAYIAAVRGGQFDLTIGTCATERPYDPDNSYYYMYHSSGTNNSAKYNNPRIDELLLAQRRAYPDNEARKKIFREITAILEEEVPVVPLYIAIGYKVMQPWVHWENLADPQIQHCVQQLLSVWIDRK